MRSTGLRSCELAGQIIRRIHPYTPQTAPTQFLSSVMGCYPAERFHCQLCRQTPCKSTIDPQLCSDSLEILWSVLRRLKVNAEIDTSSSLLKVINYCIGDSPYILNNRKRQSFSCQKLEKESQTESYQKKSCSKLGVR